MSKTTVRSVVSVECGNDKANVRFVFSSFVSIFGRLAMVAVRCRGDTTPRWSSTNGDHRVGNKQRVPFIPDDNYVP